MIASIIRQNGGIIDVSDFFGFGSIKGAAKECARVLEFDLLRSDIDFYFPKFEFSLGDSIELKSNDGDQIFKGVIWERSLNDNEPGMGIVAYDKAIYLNKNDSKKQVFTKISAGAVTGEILADLGLDAGDLAEGVEGNYNGRGMNAYDIIMLAYTKAHKKIGKDYKLVAQGDKIHVFESGDRHPVVLEDLDSAVVGKLINVSFRENLDDLINKVDQVEEGEDDELKEAIEEDKKSQNQHGVMQRLVRGEDISGELKGVNQEIEVECIGDWDMITGKSIYLKSSIVEGEFYIIEDEHVLDDGIYEYNNPLAHVVKLKLSSEFEMDEREEGQSGPSASGPVYKDVAGMLEAGKSKIGRPYIWGAAGPNAFDCSGFISWAGIQAGFMPSGARLTSGNMSSKYVHKVSWSDLRPGDILHFSGSPGHVAFYAGNGKTLESTSGGVQMKNFNPARPGRYRNVYRFNKA